MNLEQCKQKKLKRDDVKDPENGTWIIYSENLNKYLERYACKDVNELSDTLWFSYGIFVTVVD